MSTRDMYDKKMLKAMESIAKSLNRIANVMEVKSGSEPIDSAKAKELMKRYKDDNY